MRIFTDFVYNLLGVLTLFVAIVGVPIVCAALVLGPALLALNYNMLFLVLYPVLISTVMTVVNYLEGLI